MSEGQDDKKLTLGHGTLQLKKTVDTGQVRQSLSHGRGKQVVVERKRKRILTTDSPQQPEKPAEKPAPVKPAPEPVAEHLTSDEKAVRARALEEAHKLFHEEEARRAEEEARRSEAEKRAAAERALREAEQEAPPPVIEDTPPPVVELEPQPLPPAKPAKPAERRAITEEEGLKGRKRSQAPARTPGGRKGEPRRRSGKLTVTQALGAGGEERQRSLASYRRAKEKQRAAHQKALRETPHKIVREVVVPETITVQELANRMAERATAVIKALMKMDVMATVNQSIDADTAELVVAEFGHKLKRISEADVEVGFLGPEDNPEDLRPRPPVVTIMGHVDHGKTSLLDALRETDVASGEAGGITQHIGAYQVTLHSGDKITFLDTPGHEAFTAMRSRGARVTDIVVLVVAANDGIMPQTREAIDHARAAKVPIIVAINKIDKTGADPDRVRQELLQHEVIVEKMGGDVLDVEVSALKKTNLDKLGEAIVMQAELLELKANPDRPAEGAVVEARLERGRGAVATLLVQRGTIQVGDILVAGAEWGRVRALLNDRGQQIKQVGPSEPVEVLGLSGTPLAGDSFAVVEDEGRAREVTEYRQRQLKMSHKPTARASLEAMLGKLKEAKTNELPVVIKTDAGGSSEAIVGALEKLSTDEVAVRVLHAAAGGINESDVTLAKASQAPIIGFNVRASAKARQLAEREGVELRYYSVIYDLIDDIKAALSGMLAPEMRETMLGNAEVREVFSIGKAGKAAGCIVTDGVVRRGARVRLLRDDVVIHEGELSSLRRFKDEVKEVKAGTECGIALEKYNDIKVGDVIEAFEVEEVARTL